MPSISLRSSSIAFFLLLFVVQVYSIRVVKNSESSSLDNVNPDYVVATDGSGDFKTLEEAMTNAPNNSANPIVYRLKKGYHKGFTIDKPNIVLIGDGMDVTYITGNLNSKGGIGSADTATLKVKAPNFKAVNLTIENTSPEGSGPAVALQMDSDNSVLYRCALRSNQDTLLAYLGRQFYKDCVITGTVDFIYGYAQAVFQNCHIKARKYYIPCISANGRASASDKSGFVMQYCNITRTKGLPAKPANTYLGRPWMEYSRTVVMQSFLDENINPVGWLATMEAPVVDSTNSENQKNMFFAEYKNHGPGSPTGSRMPGVYFLTEDQAKAFTVDKFIDGSTWLPATGVPYIGGLGVQ
ncbi:hypothetical protein ACFE04_010683 [Oxalis oulophora]